MPVTVSATWTWTSADQALRHYLATEDHHVSDDQTLIVAARSMEVRTNVPSAAYSLITRMVAISGTDSNVKQIFESWNINL